MKIPKALILIALYFSSPEHRGEVPKDLTVEQLCSLYVASCAEKEASAVLHHHMPDHGVILQRIGAHVLAVA